MQLAFVSLNVVVSAGGVHGLTLKRQFPDLELHCVLGKKYTSIAPGTRQQDRDTYQCHGIFAIPFAS